MIVQPGRIVTFGIGIFLILLLFNGPVLADVPQDITITYLITLHPDSSATWNVQYRIPQQVPGDIPSFENNTNSSSILSEDNLRQLTAQSAKDAADSTGRTMAIRNFSRTTAYESTPTGSYGVIRYTFLWTNFTDTGDGLAMGDAFQSGLYLPVGAALIIQVPDGYSVTSVEPAGGTVNGNLVWYGPEPFEAGKPSIKLVRKEFPLGPAVAFVVLVLGSGIAAFFLWRRRKNQTGPATNIKSSETEGPDRMAIVTTKHQEDESPVEIEVCLGATEERILILLKENGGELYQSDIVSRLALPKSTVSSALITLHNSNCIRKIRKGRENLIRLMTDT